MASNDSAETTGEATGTVVGRRKAARYMVPVAVAGVAAVTIGLVPALADSGDPDLPKITAQELVEKIAASDEEQLSGTVKISTDLGIPSLGGLAGSFAPGGQGSDSTSSAAPDAKLMELASGTHTLRVAADGPDRQRLSILGEGSEYSVVHNGDDVWAYDSESNEVYHARSEETGGKAGKHTAPKGVPTTPKELAEEALAAADDTTSVTVDGTAQVAGRDAYQLLIKPKQSGSTIGSVRVAVDASTGVPLKFTLSPSSGGKAAIDAGFTKVDFAKPDASSFSFTPPKGAEVTEADELKAEAGKKGATDKAQQDLGALEDFKGVNVIGEGWNAVAEIELPGGAGLPADGSGDMPAQAQQFLDALGDKVTGDFGSGTVFRTRLVNALMTDDGKVYVGAVTKDALVKAADTAE
ncbi:sigma-E factor regulatory protein RseB domain-containing protein [Streptomyces sp. B1I3]|uniref:LolA family protein n=1 Tax=Streptomyces sp. B1I3 TaxID=3042264 RepID=UPI002780F833|nr:sigma-E factor regulatory protein RseB domain-containing protein [Streptomyces sp. B1I3]MDQ0794646.1 outer membrane lipoprotein-sorting protein [Streptomyces sp. B1I3]